MGRSYRYLAAALLAAAMAGCISQKYVLLKGTSLANPPTGAIKIAIGEFPVESKAAVVDPTAAVSSPHDPGGGVARPAAAGIAGETRDMEIARASRIEDLAGSVLRELRRDRVRIFVYWDQIANLDEVREFDNPFELVSAESGEADLIVSGEGLIRSRRIAKRFTRQTDFVEIGLSVVDVSTGAEVTKDRLRLGVNLVFNSEELEEAMAIGVVTHLLQKTF